ncbi:MAG: hypothetical protein EAZ24_01190, partial [Burkholderiales bacterium]
MTISTTRSQADKGDQLPIDITRAEIRSFLRGEATHGDSDPRATSTFAESMPTSLGSVVLDTLKRIAAEHPVAIVAEATAPVVREQ